MRDNHLYRDCPNRYLNNVQRLKPTTLITGAKCADGVILVGDRKVTSSLGTTESVTYTDKIRRCGHMNWAILGAAGVATLYEELLGLLPQRADRHFNWIQYQNQKLLNQHSQDFRTNPTAREPPLIVYSIQDFLQDCVELLTEMRNRHSIAFANPSCRLDALIGLKVTNEPSKLYYLNSTYCLPADVNEILMIGQGELAEIFRKSWERNMTMEQVAKLGILAIRYIEQEGISDSIGVGTNKPQVWFIPNANDQVAHEVTGDELDRLVTEAYAPLGTVHAQFHSLFRT